MPAHGSLSYLFDDEPRVAPNSHDWLHCHHCCHFSHSYGIPRFSSWRFFFNCVCVGGGGEVRVNVHACHGVLMEVKGQFSGVGARLAGLHASG